MSKLKMFLFTHWRDLWLISTSQFIFLKNKIIVMLILTVLYSLIFGQKVKKQSKQNLKGYLSKTTNH